MSVPQAMVAVNKFVTMSLDPSLVAVEMGTIWRPIDSTAMVCTPTFSLVKISSRCFCTSPSSLPPSLPPSLISASSLLVLFPSLCLAFVLSLVLHVSVLSGKDCNSSYIKNTSFVNWTFPNFNLAEGHYDICSNETLNTDLHIKVHIIHVSFRTVFVSFLFAFLHVCIC